jgi:hypothetical protein
MEVGRIIAWHKWDGRRWLGLARTATGGRGWVGGWGGGRMEVLELVVIVLMRPDNAAWSMQLPVITCRWKSVIPGAAVEPVA